jgi:hypothetical protein
MEGTETLSIVSDGHGHCGWLRAQAANGGKSVRPKVSPFMFHGLVVRRS